MASAHVGLSSVGLSVSPHHDFGFSHQPSTWSPPPDITVWLLPPSFPL